MFVYINTSKFRLQRLRKILIFHYGYSVESYVTFKVLLKYETVVYQIRHESIMQHFNLCYLHELRSVNFHSAIGF